MKNVYEAGAVLGLLGVGALVFNYEKKHYDDQKKLEADVATHQSNSLANKITIESLQDKAVIELRDKCRDSYKKCLSEIQLREYCASHIVAGNENFYTAHPIGKESHFSLSAEHCYLDLGQKMEECQKEQIACLKQ